MRLQAKGRSGSDTSLEVISAARGGRIFSAYFPVNCLLHISVNYTENVTDLYAHAQTVDTRRSSPIFQAPGYEATIQPIFKLLEGSTSVLCEVWKPFASHVQGKASCLLTLEKIHCHSQSCTTPSCSLLVTM